MKKFITFIIMACMMCTMSLAQQAAFMGIPIEGDINAFFSKIEAKGFVLDVEDYGGNIYEGKFTGEDVMVTIMPGKDNKVSMVGVYLPLRETWSDVLNDFEKYARMYTGKYGEPDITDRDLGSHTPGTAAFKADLENERIDYKNIYIVDNIFISISPHEAITDLSADGYQLLILYINDDNYIDEEEDYSDQI